MVLRFELVRVGGFEPSVSSVQKARSRASFDALREAGTAGLLYNLYACSAETLAGKFTQPAQPWLRRGWTTQQDSNLRPPASHAGALIPLSYGWEHDIVSPGPTSGEQETSGGDDRWQNIRRE